MCWFSLQRWSETFLILRRIQRDIIINLYRSSCKYRLFLSGFNGTWIILTDFRKELVCRISSKSILWEPMCSVRAGRRTDMTKLIVTSRNFANAPDKSIGRTPAILQWTYSVSSKRKWWGVSGGSSSAYSRYWREKTDRLGQSASVRVHTVISYLLDIVMSVCPSARNISAPSVRILMKFGVWVLFENLCSKFKFL